MRTRGPPFWMGTASRIVACPRARPQGRGQQWHRPAICYHLHNSIGTPSPREGRNRISSLGLRRRAQRRGFSMSIVTGPRHRTGQKSRLAVLFACAAFTLVPAASPFAAGVDRPTDRTGLIFTAMDRSVRPQNDFYGYANGTWLKNTPIPPDKSSYGLDN